MIRFIPLMSLLLWVASCSSSNPVPAPLGFAACSDNPGYLCNGSQVQGPILDGNCTKDQDCPPPYNDCVNDICRFTPAPVADPRIWFVTDPIRPGVTEKCNGTNGIGRVACSNPDQLKDYIYNIMAKGYSSLDDWCMSQAQKSTKRDMRNIPSWKAFMMSSGVDFTRFLTTTYGVLSLTYPRQSPGFQLWTTAANTIFDKNNTAPSGKFYWSGIRNRVNVARGTAQFCRGRNPLCSSETVCSPFNPDTGSCHNELVGCAGYYSPFDPSFYTIDMCRGCTVVNQNSPAVIPTVISPETVTMDLYSGVPQWSDFDPRVNYGCAILTPANCTGGIAMISNYGFSDRNFQGTTTAFDIQTSGNLQNPIICVAN